MRVIAFIQNHLIKGFFLWAIFGCFTQSVFAWSNIKRVPIELNKDTIQVLDSACVFRSILIMLDTNDVTKYFTLLSERRQILVPSQYKHKTVVLVYREIFFPPKLPLYNKTHLQLDFDPNRPMMTSVNTYSKASVFQNNDLQSSGNLSRAMSVGSAQGLILNSQLNLQLKGQLGRGYWLQAAMTDDNTPVQGQGTTQQIQDFDQVYIAIKKDSSEIIAGDFLMQTNGEHRFLKYYKKSRGMHLQNPFNGTKHSQQLNVAVSRGRFNRMEIQGIEGVQGPYKLNGISGELNVLVISGTEVVYVNGVKLQRGQQFDYTIDYTLGEVYFMPTTLINQFSRIVIEFQYSDRQYLRSVSTISDAFQWKQSKFNVQYFSEQDHKQQVTDTFQSSQIAEALSGAGDQSIRLPLNVAYKSYQANRINYRKIDSLGQSIFLFTNDAGSDSIFYVCQFTYVGLGKGHYKAIASNANGRVFAWVASVNGQLMGDYEADRLLQAPKHYQMLNGTWRQQLGLKSELQIDLAYSNSNQNTYSLKDKSNDDGIAGFLQFKQGLISYGRFSVSHLTQFEKTSTHFAAPERYRSVEFNRLWNRQLNNTALIGAGPESVLQSKTAFKWSKRHGLDLDVNAFQKGHDFKGVNLGFKYQFNYKSFNLMYAVDALQSKTTRSTQSAQNNLLSIVIKQSKSQFKLNLQSENSLQLLDSNQQILDQSFDFKQMQLQWTRLLHNAWQSQIEWTLREDYRPELNRMRYASTIKQLSYNLLHNGSKGQLLKFQTHYRLVHLPNQADLPILLMRLESSQHAVKHTFVLNTYYQVSAGREQKRIYSFTTVQTGYGTHIWVDYNQNGLEELNEFELAVFKDQANYVKVLLPSNELVNCQAVDFNQSLKWTAPIEWQRLKGLKQFLSRIQSVSSFKHENKVQNQAFGGQLNPFDLASAQSDVLLTNAALKQSLFFNRYHSKFGLEYHYANTQNKQLMTWGFDQKFMDKHSLQTRFNLLKRFNVITEVQQFSKGLKSDLFNNRQYQMQSFVLRQELVYQHQQHWRFGAIAQFTRSENAQMYGGELALIKAVGVECRYYKVNIGNIDFKWTTHAIQFNGQASTPLAFDVLNGLKSGKNQTWSIGLGAKTKRNLQLNLVYDGRLLPNAPVVHVGRVEAKYLF